jgi:ubiquitin C-terminal hydrolase
MNSILQCLASTHEMVHLFSREGVAGGKLSKATGALVRDLWADGAGGGSGVASATVTPRDLLSAVIRLDRRFGGGRQHDSQEFLHCVLEGLQSELNRVKAKPKYKELEGKGEEEAQAEEAWEYSRSWADSAIDDIFGGQLQSTVECSICHHRSHCFDPFLDLSVPIPRGARSSVGHDTRVQDCLASFTATEQLEGSDQYRCEKCKKIVQAEKKLSICRYPRVLVLHLKRFASSGGAGGGSAASGRSSFGMARSSASFSKDTSYVSFTERGLDIGKYCSPHAAAAGCEGGRLGGAGAGDAPPVYDLYAVSNHSGSLGGGHYTAAAKSIHGERWFNYNDSRVSASGTAGERGPGGSSEAYVLFYRLRGQGGPGA